MTKKVLITNIVSLNPGDAAILLGMKCLLEAKYGKDVNLIVYDRNAAAAQKYYNWCTFKQSLFTTPSPGAVVRAFEKIGYKHLIERLNFYRICIAQSLKKRKLGILARLFTSSSTIKKIDDYLTADLIMCSGGTFLTENYNFQSCLYDFRFSQRTQAKLGIFPQTLGPYKHPGNIQQLTSTFNQFDILMLRDKASKKHLTEIGISDKNIQLIPDAAFCIGHFITLPTRTSKNQQNMKVAVSVRPLKFFEDGKEELYINSIAQLVVDLVTQKHAQVSFVSTCQGIEEYWSSDDKMADRIVEKLPAEVRRVVTVDRKFRDPLAFIEKCVEFDFIIATRMHAAIMAISCGIPAIAIAYEFKIAELYKNLGLEAFYSNIDSNMNAKLNEAIEKVYTPEFTGNFEDSRRAITRQSLTALQYLPE